MAKKASDHFKVYQNPDGPTISTVSRPVFQAEGLWFKDIDGTGKLSAVNDWRLSPEDRAAAYVKELTLEEKIGQLFISDWRMGPKYPSPRLPGHVTQPDESGCLDEAEVNQKTIFGQQKLPGTTTLIKDWFARHMILRANPKPDQLADWMNQIHSVAEECTHLVPVQVTSNSRNENGEVVFGMNDAAGVFATWPGTLGIAAAVKGDSLELIDGFADCIRREWDAVGMKKGYMYMADILTDPRWQRSYGTFGEDPQLICDIMSRLIPIVQGSENGVTPDGVALTIKHFPGGGARENGFDPHYAEGQWNVYQTAGSLQKYHIPAFQVAVDKKASSIMPYYAKPAAAKSAPQTDKNGDPMEFQPFGFAYNKPFIDKLLREQMGFTGYINSDTGIVHNMCWGVEMLDKAERIGFAINHAGTDVISGMYDMELGKEAYNRAKNGYYDTHEVPAGFTKDQLVLTDEVLDRAVTRTMTEMFALGMFENPYRDPRKALEVVSNAADWARANEVHRKSVVLLKNDGSLPMAPGKKVYAEAFNKRPEAGEAATRALREMLGKEAVTLVETPAEADVALLMLTPSSGDYFNATAGYLELDICDGKTVCDTDQTGCPTDKTHLETTLTGANKIKEIAEAVHQNGGKVFANVNVTLPWLLGNVEPFADVLTLGFDTYPSATLDVFFGRFKPTGKLPLTLPKDDRVIAVSPEGVCISPNDVPGYDKDQYMPESMKDENGKAYAYRDAAGNYYEMNFGL